MNRKNILALFMTLIMISTFSLPTLSAFGQVQTLEKSDEENRAQAVRTASPLRIVDRYREGGNQRGKRAGKGSEQNQTLAQKQERPEWAKEALRQSLGQVQQSRERYGVQNAEAEFHLKEAMKDARGYKHIRLRKMHSGVEVFGGERIAHLDDKNVLLSMGGRAFKGIDINTTPAISEAQAIATAKSALNYRGEFAEEPVAELVVLPEQIRTGNEKAEGATLVYKVKLQPAKGGMPTADRRYFISAIDGSIVWQLNNQRSEDGIGFSTFNGVVTVNTTRNDDETYTLIDPNHAESQIFNANNGDGDADNDDFFDSDAFDGVFTGDDNLWGTLGDTTNPETVAVDVHFGVAQSWEYFLHTHGRDGADGEGTRIRSFVHYRSQEDQDAGRATTNNAFGGHNMLRFGDGDGVQYGPNVSIDIVGHEFTHCVVDAVLPDDGLIYSGESGAIDESLADIFGTAVGFYSGTDEDYLQSDDIVIPGSGGVARRDLENPRTIQINFGDGTSFILPDHYADRYTGTMDGGGVHLNSSIMNHVYYLLAEGGTHRNGTYVPAIGRLWAEQMFYAVLVAFLTPSATFEDVANAMIEVASVYGIDERRAVERAWFAVGVLPTLNDPMPTPDLTRSRIILYSMLGDGLTTKFINTGWMQWLRDYSGQFGRNWTHIISMGSELFYYNGSNGTAAVGRIGADGTHYTTQSFPRNYFKVGWSSITWHEGYLFFYDRSNGLAQIGQMTPTGYRTIRTYPAGNFSTNWTHIISAQGYLFLYDQNSGVAVVGDWAYNPSPRWQDLHYYNLQSGWSHIVDGGVRSGAETGILFYNKNNATYEVGDIGSGGNFTSRAGTSRWAYNFIRLGYTDVIRVGQGLLLYNENERKAKVGYLLTPGESDRFGKEPFQTIKDLSESYFPAYYAHVAAHNL
jgi:Zn-dependent metalloprotease